jgi:hypothetical protein
MGDGLGNRGAISSRAWRKPSSGTLTIHRGGSPGSSEQEDIELRKLMLMLMLVLVLATLQWGRAHVSAEMKSAAANGDSDRNASMGRASASGVANSQSKW